MKVKRFQKYERYNNTTTVVLDSLSEANGLIRRALDDKEAELPKHFNDYMKIIQANANYMARGMGNSLEALRSELEEALHQIEHGKPAIEDKANQLCEQFLDRAKEIEPSLTLETPWSPDEGGDMWDAGKIAEEAPLAFFNRKAEEKPKTGRGDGAFRILINTDVHSAADPTRECAALMALVLVLQRSAPVEIWIQQGWLGAEATDGVTLFRIFSGSQLQPKNIWFWVGSEHKDSPYSWCVNRMLGRRQSAVSRTPELPCDLYVYGAICPSTNDKEGWSQWVANTAKPLLFDEELPENWKGYDSKI